MIKFLIKTFRQLLPMTDKEYTYQYLVQSVDNVDLERQMKDLDRMNIRSY